MSHTTSTFREAIVDFTGAWTTAIHSPNPQNQLDTLKVCSIICKNDPDSVILQKITKIPLFEHFIRGEERDLFRLVDLFAERGIEVDLLDLELKINHFFFWLAGGDNGAALQRLVEEDNRVTSEELAEGYSNNNPISAISHMRHSNNQQPLLLAVKEDLASLEQLAHSNHNPRDHIPVPAILRMHNPPGATLFHIAAAKGLASLVQFIAEKYPSLLLKEGPYGFTPLQWALFFRKNNSHDDAIQILIKNCPNLSFAPDRHRDTPLHIASTKRKGCEKHVRLIVEKDPNTLTTLNVYGETPLHRSIFSSRNENTIKFLANANPDTLTIPSAIGETPLEAAILYRNVNIIKILVDANPDILSPQNSGFKILTMAIRNKRNSAVRLIAEKYPELLTMKSTQREAILHMRGETVLHSAAAWGLEIIVRLIVEKYPELLTVKSTQGQTPLHSAAAAGKKDIVRLIVEKYPELLTVKNTQGWTPLHSAAAAGQEDTVRLLVEKHPELLTMKNTQGWTPLHFAAKGGHKNVVQFLLEKNPELLTVKTPQGETSLDIAAAEGHGNTALILRNIEQPNRQMTQDIFLAAVGSAAGMVCQSWREQTTHTSLALGAGLGAGVSLAASRFFNWLTSK